MTGKRPSAVLTPLVAVPAALTGIAALVGILGAGTEAPCGKMCSEVSPDPSAEAWIVAFVYVGIIAALCAGRVLGATELAPAAMPRYRGSLGSLGATSLLLAIFTPGSWEPLRPALIVGGLSSLVFLIVGGRLADVGRDRPHDRHQASGREGL